ncbi:hypothetical protein PG994_013988 [Apiospora phragmitis]|uniref:Ankyrin n=1 Tax=Apiospora phragmitis TaxID=2905665 RepID=A0ABR1T309_9PEZI
MAERKTGKTPVRPTGGAAAEVEDGVLSQADDQLTDPMNSLFEALAVEIVLLIARCCHNARDQAKLAQANKWLNVIVRTIVYETICADSEWSVIFWAAERGHTFILQAIDAASKRHHTTTCNPGCPVTGFINWDMYREDMCYTAYGVLNYIPPLRYEDKTMRPKDKWVYAENDNPTGYYNVFCKPLHLAVLNGHLETVRFLLDRGVNVDAISNRIGMPGLAYKTLIPVPHVERVILGKFELQIAVTPLVLATHYGEYDTTKLLLQHGASVQLRRSLPTRLLRATILHLLDNLPRSKKTCQFVEMLVRRKYALVDAPDPGSLTPLARAAAIEDGGPMMETLKELGADVNYVILTMGAGQSILDACIRGNLSAAQRSWDIDRRLQAARRFIELGADAGAKGATAIPAQLLSKPCAVVLWRQARRVDRVHRTP